MLDQTITPSNCICNSPGAVDITGCRFSLYPMTDNFVDIIVSAVKKIDTTKVWSHTDHLSTLYRGKQSHVIDCARAAFIFAGQTDKHLVSELTFSRGCPGDVDADRFLAVDDNPQNMAAIALGDFKVYGKISFYVFGDGDYMQHIMQVVELAKKHGLNPKKAHYVTLLEGSASDIFAYFDAALNYAQQNLNHYVLEATLSINSPSHKPANEDN